MSLAELRQVVDEAVADDSRSDDDGACRGGLIAHVDSMSYLRAPLQPGTVAAVELDQPRRSARRRRIGELSGPAGVTATCSACRARPAAPRAPPSRPRLPRRRAGRRWRFRLRVLVGARAHEVGVGASVFVGERDQARAELLRPGQRLLVLREPRRELDERRRDRSGERGPPNRSRARASARRAGPAPRTEAATRASRRVPVEVDGSAASGVLPRIRSAAFSASIITGA